MKIKKVLSVLAAPLVGIMFFFGCSNGDGSVASVKNEYLKTMNILFTQVLIIIHLLMEKNLKMKIFKQKCLNMMQMVKKTLKKMKLK